MARSKWVVGVAAVGLVVAGGVAWWLQNDPPSMLRALWGGAAEPGAASAPAPKAGASAAQPAGGTPGRPNAVAAGPGGAPTAAPGAPAASARAGGGGPPGGPSGAGAGAPGGRGGPGGPAGVEVARVAKASFVDDTQSLGTLRARRSVVVRPEASGRIQALKFTDGQRVRKGALLVQLDDTLQQAQLQQAEASASIARTNLQRSRELAAQNFVSQSAVDQNAAALEVAMAQVALAQAQVGRMRIMAPFDGITGIRSVNVGDYVKDGAELVVLEDLGAVWVDFRLPERYLSRLREGQSVELSLDAMPGKTYQAKVVALDAQLDTNGRALLVRASLANEDGRLRGGMFARVRTVFSTRDQALVVPEEALVPVGDDQVVFKVVDSERGKIARRVSVRIGARLPGKVEIVDGLAEGDVVVVAGQARLVRGDNLPVRVVDLNRPASGGAAGAGGAGRPPGAAGAPRAQGEPGASGARGASGAGAPAGEGARSAGTGRPS